MGKFQRYYSETENKTEDSKSASKEAKVYHVNPKPKPWGRRNADRQIAKQQPKQTPQQRQKSKRPEIPKELLEKYSKGVGINKTSIKTKIHQKRIQNKEQIYQFAAEQSARAEILLTEDSGFLEADAGETTTQFTQNQIAASVDISAATKCFDLQLNDFGPYRMKYTRNGRHLLIGGQRGHVAAFDWVTKKLHCEINVMESVHDVSFLHLETMFAVAQKNWVHIYDHQGIELNCVKTLNRVTRMEFLPYHFLLATCSDMGYLSWLDVSIGQMVSQFNTRLGRLTMLAQNPWNATLCLGHSKGVVSIWSPNSKDPLAKMLCHKAPLQAVHVDPQGRYMATAASNREIKIWDIRKLEGPIQQYKLKSAATNVAFSQKNMLAVGMGNVVEVYRDCIAAPAKRAYLRHRFVTGVENFCFCPYEDVLGVAHSRGVSSLLIPGSGEPNFDAFEANPFQTKSQRREAEVKSLLEKIQPELITLDPTVIAEVDVPTLKEKVEAQQKLLHVKAPRINYDPRKKAKGKGGSVKIAKNKKIVNEQAKKDFFKSHKDLLPNVNFQKRSQKSFGVLDRFVPKQTTK